MPPGLHFCRWSLRISAATRGKRDFTPVTNSNPVYWLETSMGLLRFNNLVFILLFLNTAFSAFGQPAAKPAANSGYAGSTACRTCHPNVALQFFRNPHNKSDVSSSVPV